MFFPFITGKNFGFRIIVEIIFAAWLLLAYYKPDYRPKFSWIMGAMTLFVGIIFTADLFGANMLKSFWSNYERMEGFVGLIHNFAFFVVIGSVFTRELWTKYFQTFLFSSVAMSFYGLLQVSGTLATHQGGRLDGSFGNASYMAVYMLFNVFIASYLFTRLKKGNAMRWVYGGVAVFDLFILYYTQTRGTILGLLAGIAVASILTIIFEKKRPKLVRNMSLVFGGLVLMIALFFVFKDSSFVRQSPVLARMAAISLTEQTTVSRFMVWGMAIEGFKERPILGWGQENFNIVFNKYYNPGMYNQEQWFDRAHDIFFDWLIAGGILGLLSYLLLFAVGIALIWKPTKPVSGEGILAKIKHIWTEHTSGEESDKVLSNSILTGLFAAYFVHNIFVFDNLFSYILFFSVLAFLHSNNVSFRKQEKFVKGAPQIKKAETVPFLYAGFGMALAFVFVLYIVNIKPILANQSLIRGMSPQASAKGAFSEENVNAFKTAVSYNTFGNQEIREQLVQTAMRMRSVEGNDALLEKLFDTARSEALLQVSEASRDARAEVFVGMLFYNFGVMNEAISHFEKAHTLSPKKQTISQNLALSYMNGGKTEKALTLAKETYELEKSNTEAAKLYAVSAIAVDKQEEGDKVLTEAFGTTLVFDENLINVYGMKGRYDKIVLILKSELAKKEDPKLRLRLAAAYVESGNPSQGITEIEKIILSNPDFKQQGEYYINLIRSGKNP